MSREEQRRDYSHREMSELIVSFILFQEKIMSALSDLQAAVAALTTEVGLVVTQLGKGTTGTPDSALTPLTTAVAAATASLAAAMPAPTSVAPAAPEAPTPPAAS